MLHGLVRNNLFIADGIQDREPWRARCKYVGEAKEHGYYTPDLTEGPSLPGVLRDAGYQTEWVGRGMHQTPPDKRYGFDHMDESFHATNWAVSESLQFLDRRDPSCPFFLVTSILAPHPPLVPPAFYFDRYLRQELPTPAIGDWAAPPANDGMGLEASSDRVNLHGEMLRSVQAGYFGLINHVDDQIRRLLNPVDGILAFSAAPIATRW